MSKEESTPKIGTGHASAMFRQGLRELRGALYPESNVAQPTEYGIYGTRTPGEVAQDRREQTQELNEEAPSIIGERLREAEARERQLQDEKEQRRGMERE